MGRPAEGGGGGSALAFLCGPAECPWEVSGHLDGGCGAGSVLKSRNEILGGRTCCWFS